MKSEARLKERVGSGEWKGATRSYPNLEQGQNSRHEKARGAGGARGVHPIPFPYGIC